MSMSQNRLAGLAGLVSAVFLFQGQGRCAADEPAKPAPFVVSARSGAWSSADTWVGRKVPGAFSRVRIAEGHTVVYDLVSDQVIRMIHVAGTLTFAHDRDTRLDVGLIRIQAGSDCGEEGFDCEAHVKPPDPHKARPALEIGTPLVPIAAKHSALIRLIYCEGMDKESLPAIVCCGGRWDVQGAAMSRTWVELGADAKKGASQVTLAEPGSGWKPGDTLIITASNNHKPIHTYRGKTIRGTEGRLQTEERRIVTIEGLTVTLDKPLAYEHLGTGEMRSEVANLSRNVVIESALSPSPPGRGDGGEGLIRGHTMYHRHSAGSLAYAEFRHLGKEGLLGKYPIHYHLVGDTMRGSSVVGVSVWDSHNRWVVIHGTDHLLVRDCVGYQSIGHGYFLEDGAEQYNVLDRNLAVQAYLGKPLPKQALPFDKNEGAGFWWANGRNTLTRNVACETERYGFLYEMTRRDGFNTVLPLRLPEGGVKNIDVRTVPFFRFEDNEAHSTRLYGFKFGDPGMGIRGDREHPFILRNNRAWQTRYGLRPNMEFVLVDGLKVWSNSYGIYGPSLDGQVFRNLHLKDLSATIIGSRNPTYAAGVSPLPTATFENVTLENCRGHMGFGATRFEVHFRNLEVKNCSKHGIIRENVFPPERYPYAGSYFFHDFPLKGAVAQVAHTTFAEKATGQDFKPSEGFLAGNLRAATLKSVPFPSILDPVDDLPPATMITSVVPQGVKLLVRGVTHDNGDVKSISVNGTAAKTLSSQAGVVDWEALVDRPANGVIVARGVDQAGNAEAVGHRIVTGRLD